MRFIFTCLLVSLVILGGAQTPFLINYQGVARDASANPLSNQGISVKFEILQGSATGSVVYTDSQTGITTNTLGLFSTQIGKTAGLNQLNWQNASYYLRVSMDPNGGSNLAVLGTQQIVSVPYALQSQNVPSSYTNNVLTIGTNSYAINSGTAVTVSSSGTNISVSGGPNFTLAFVPPALPQLAISSNSLSILGSNTITLPAAATPTLYPSGIATVTNGVSAYTVGVTAPAYNQASGVLSMGSSTTLVAPTLGLAGGVLYSGPFTNSVSIPTAVTVSGTGQATVTGGPNYLVNVGLPQLALSANNLSLSIVGSNSVALPAAVTVAGSGSIVSVTGGPTNYTVSVPNPSYNGTVLTLGTSTTAIAPTLGFSGGILTSGPASNSVSLNNFGPFVQAGTSVTLTTVSNSVALGLNAAGAKLDVYSNTGGPVLKVTDASATNTVPAVSISSGGVISVDVTNNSTGGIGGNFNAANGYAIKAQNSNSLNATIFAQNSSTGPTSSAGYFVGGIAAQGTSSTSSAYALQINNSVSANLFHVRNDGFVGVGYNNPVARLDVNGNLHLNSGSLYLGAVGGVNSGYTGIYSNGSGDLTMAVFKSGAGSTSFGSANSLDALVVKAQTGNVGIGTSAPAATLDVIGNVKISDGSQALGKVLMSSDAAGTASWTSSPPAISFGSLNNSSVLVGTSTTTLGTGAMSFTKYYTSTEVEITMISNASAGVFSGANNIYFEIYVDGSPGSAAARHYFFTSGQTNYITLKSYFAGLSTGTHTISIVAATDAGTSSGVLLDSGGYNGKVLVKERF